MITGVGSVYRGPDGYRRCIEGLFGDYDDARVEVHDLIEAEDRVLVSMTARGRGKQRGVETSWSVCQVWTLRDGTISRGQGYTRRDEALEAAGLRE